jgi:NAD-dependent DNA ligase
VNGFGKSTIEKVFHNGHQTVPAILNLTVQDFEKFDGIQEKTAKKIVHSMQEKISSVHLSKFMALSTMFDRGFGEKKLTLLIKGCPTWFQVTDENYAQKLDEIVNIKGMTIKSATQFLKNTIPFLEFLRDCNLEYKLNVQNVANSVQHPQNQRWKNKIIVFSGFRNENLAKEIVESGGQVKDSVSSKTNVVLVKDLEKETSKTKKAKLYNIPIEKI